MIDQDKVTQEKNNLIRSAKDLEINLMAEEEYQELARLFLNSNLQLVELFEYFTRYPEKLLRNDYQTMLQVFLFSGEKLTNALAIDGFADLLERFIKKNYLHFYENNGLETALFLLKLARQLNHFCPGREFFQQPARLLSLLLARDGLDSDLKCLVYSELLALTGEKSTITDPEMILFLTGMLFLEENHQHSRYQVDSYVLNQIYKVFDKNRDQFIIRLCDNNSNQALLNQLLQASRAAVGERQWRAVHNLGQSTHFATSEATIVYYPTLPRLVSPNREGLLPSSIKQNPLFQQLFPDREHGPPISQTTNFP